jgi:hypothetical protein
LARSDEYWQAEAEVARKDGSRGSPAGERLAFVRFLAGGDGWQAASRQLSGAFAQLPCLALAEGKAE